MKTHAKALHIMSAKLKLLSSALALLSATTLQAGPAGTVGPVGWSLDAFGTLGAIHSDNDQADFVTTSYFHPRGAGYSDPWRTDQDSKVGLQLTATLTERLTAVIQGISQLQYDNTFRPGLEWANLKYQVTPELSVRLGRVLSPTYLTSDTQNVGYTNLWVRTPAEVAIGLPITNIDGINFTYRSDIGDVSNRIEALYGVNKAKIPGGLTYANTGIYAVADIIEYGPATLHLGYQKMYYTYAPDSEIDPQKEKFACFEVGVLYDPGRWYLTGEIFNGHDQLIGSTNSWYVGGGYRIGDVTAYITKSKLIQTTTGTWELAPLFSQQSWAAGLRWDFWKNLDAKLQLDRVENGSVIVPTSFVNLQPGFGVGSRANVLSVAIDFVW